MDESFCADYINISFKGGFNDYLRYGYKDTKEELEKNFSMYTSKDFSDKVEWSIVYHNLIIDLNTTYDLMGGLDCKPDYFTVSQLQVGECYDSFINDLTPPTREEIVKIAEKFKKMPSEHLLIETKEYGREIII